MAILRAENLGFLRKSAKIKPAFMGRVLFFILRIFIDFTLGSRAVPAQTQNWRFEFMLSVASTAFPIPSR